jgi:hypothetical protein
LSSQQLVFLGKIFKKISRFSPGLNKYCEILKESLSG